VLGAFAKFTGLNIVASDKPRGAVTLHLDNVPWRAAFDTLLDVNGLAMEQRSNVIWVAPLSELAARERQRFEAHARAAELEPLASRTWITDFFRDRFLFDAPAVHAIAADPDRRIRFVQFEFEFAGRRVTQRAQRRMRLDVDRCSVTPAIAALSMRPSRCSRAVAAIDTVRRDAASTRRHASRRRAHDVRCPRRARLPSAP
jgi:Secretin and TonB N terminus short domain